MILISVYSIKYWKERLQFWNFSSCFTIIPSVYCKCMKGSSSTYQIAIKRYHKYLLRYLFGSSGIKYDLFGKDWIYESWSFKYIKYPVWILQCNLWKFSFGTWICTGYDPLSPLPAIVQSVILIQRECLRAVRGATYLHVNFNIQFVVGIYKEMALINFVIVIITVS